MILDSIKKMIEQEIEWCKNNPHVQSEEFQFAFIQGLKQARTLIEQVESRVAYMSDTDDVLAAKIAEAVAEVGEAELNEAKWYLMFKKANTLKRAYRKENYRLLHIQPPTLDEDECAHCGHSKIAHSSHGCRQPMRHGHCDCFAFMARLNIH